MLGRFTIPREQSRFFTSLILSNLALLRTNVGDAQALAQERIRRIERDSLLVFLLRFHEQPHFEIGIAHDGTRLGPAVCRHGPPAFL